MKFSRGLAALILIIFFQTSLVAAEYLYKDEVVNNPKFRTDINTLGSELYEKTGISLRLVMVRELKNNLHIIDYEEKLIKEFNEPTILLTFSELNSKVDILASDSSLYKYFNKKQVLSPVASPVQSFVMALIYSKSIDQFLETVTDYGGTIIPILSEKSQKGEVVGKYSGAMFNGYADIAEQIAASKDVVLEHAIGNGNKNTILFFKVLFYGLVIYAIVMYFRRKIYKKRHPNG